MLYRSPIEVRLDRIESQNAPRTNDSTQFDGACETFRNICLDIGNRISSSEFKGSFEEIIELADSDFAKTQEGMILINKLNAQNNFCTYLGDKLGLKQPQWWYRCWE